MSAINLLLDAARALLELGPSLLANVLFTFVGTALLIWCGHQISQLFASLTPSRDLELGTDAVDTILSAYVWGAVYALVLMYTLGGLGVYTAPALWAAILLPGAVRGRRSLALPFATGNPGWKVLPFVILSLGPLLISLTCPVPSWMDVLEGNVGPVQRLVTFAAFDQGNSLPSALYPVNRATPLYTAFYGLLARSFGMDGYEVLAATLVPTLLITLLAAYRLGKALLPANGHAGWMAAASWVLTYQYMHLQSSRSTVWQMTFALIALAKAIELYRQPGNRSLLLSAAFATAAAILAHPFEGFFTAVAVSIIAATAWWSDSFRNGRSYLIAAGVGIAACAPMLWTWWPSSSLAMAIGAVLLLLLFFLVRLPMKAGANSDIADRQFPRRRLLLALPAVAALSTAFLFWDFYVWGNHRVLERMLVAFPVPAGLSIALITMNVRRPSTGTMLAGAAIVAATLPLWILPHFEFHPVTVASFRFEFPLKGIDFWLSTVLAVSASTVMAQLWASTRHRKLARAYVLALLVLPTSILLGQDRDHSMGNFYSMTEAHLRLAAKGYWRGWGDPRYVARKYDRDFFEKLRSMVRAGEIGPADRIAHVAPGSNLQATPFPAFTGVAQDLYLPSVDTTDVHTRGGRLYDIDERKPQNKLLLVEKSMLPAYQVGGASIVYENRRVILFSRVRE